MVTKTRKRCPTGQHKDKKTGKCIGTRKNRCPREQRRNKTTGKCEKDKDLGRRLKRVDIKIGKITNVIESKKKNIEEIEKIRGNLVQEKNTIEKKIIRKDGKRRNKKEIKKEIKNLKKPSPNEMESNAVANICERKELCKFGDIFDKDGYRHYGHKFVGKNRSLEVSTRINTIDHEAGVVVPINITKYLTDAVSKYSKLENEFPGLILVYELPYHDVTVQKYNVKKNHMYEYVCWNESEREFNLDKWYLEQIDIKTGKRTKPSKKR